MSNEPEVETFPKNTPRENVETEKKWKLEDGAHSCTIEQLADGSWVMTTIWSDPAQDD